MGGEGSGRKTVKAEAIKCLLSVQIKMIDLIHQGFDSNKTREQLKADAEEIYAEMKKQQEEIERIK